MARSADLQDEARGVQADAGAAAMAANLSQNFAPAPASTERPKATEAIAETAPANRVEQAFQAATSVDNPELKAGLEKKAAEMRAGERVQQAHEAVAQAPHNPELARALNDKADQARPEVQQLAENVAQQTLDAQKAGTPPSETAQALLKENGPPPKLGQVMTVHGLFSGADAFKTMTDYWSADGKNKLAGTVQGAKLKEMGLSADKIKSMSPQELQDTAQKLGLNPQGNIFNMEFANNASPTAVNKEQLAAATELARRLGDGRKVDIVAHSKGGVDARSLLADGNPNVRSLTTLGTPHKGAQLADWRDNLPETLQSYARDAAVLAQGNQRTEPTAPALDELKSTSPVYQKLNSTWEQQRSQLEKAPLQVEGALGVGLGDGIVGSGQAVLPGGLQRTAWGTGHTGLTNSPAVVKEVTNYLADQPLSPQADLYDNDKLSTTIWGAHKAYDWAASWFR